MNKFMKLAGALVCAALILAVSSGRIYARLVGTSSASETCWGAAGAEVCVDSVGSLIPTTTNVGGLGTTALRFKDMFLQGNATIAGTLTTTGATTQTGVLTLSAQLVPLQQTVTQINTLVPTAVGAAIICTICTIPYSLCTATGTAAAQWARAGSATVGCGSGN